MSRNARTVLEDHLRRRREGDLDGDLACNYHPEVVVLTAREAFRGRDGVRRSAHRLWRAVADADAYVYDTVMVDDRMALLEWHAETEELRVTAGVDAFLIENGLIAAQTIHYRVESLELSVSANALSAPGETGPSSKHDPTRMPHLADS